MKKSKKSYMSISNILSEKLTLGSVLKYLKSKPFKKLPKKVDDKKLQSTLRDMNKNVDEKSDEKRVYYTGVTRAKNTLHILSTDYKYNYPIGKDYFMYLQEKK